MSSEMDRLKESFREEASDLLTELETSLLELEDSGTDMEIIGRVFRALHNIKGLGAMFGYEEMAGFAHDLETIFDNFRNGEATVTKRVIDLNLSAKDLIRTMLENPGAKGKKTSKKSKEIISALNKLIPIGKKRPARKSQKTKATKDSGTPEAPPGTGAYLIRFRPHQEIFLNGMNPLGLLNELRELGSCVVAARTGGIPSLDNIDAESCYMSWDAVLVTEKDEKAVRDVFVFVEGACELSIEMAAENAHIDEDDLQSISESLALNEDFSHEDLHDIIAETGNSGDGEPSEGAKPDGIITASSIRVSSEKLDKLASLVGELVTVQARLSQMSALRVDPELELVSEEIKRLTEDIRDNSTSIRMVPIGTTFRKLRRMVRDLSAELGKEVRFVAEGSETELDKSLIESLSDPLMHIVRNSVDHGIEMPGNRTSAGKSAEGTVRLRAEHSGGNVLIHISDDGAGIDRGAIRAKAVEKGLIEKDAELSSEDTYGLIFSAGFSSKEEITSVSGRGVGLDVVKKAVEALRGSIGVRSERGTGTTITLRLPLTLAIIDGLLVHIGGNNFVFPLPMVEECVEIKREDVGRNGRNMAVVRGDIVPYVPLARWFMVEGGGPDIQQMVITGVNGDRVGFVVDQVVGENQTVIKSLGNVYRGVEGISGATILGDGTVALILDVKGIVRKVRREEKTYLDKGRYSEANIE